MTLVYYVGRTAIRFCSRILFKLRMDGGDNVPTRGPAIFAMNHQSFLDPPLAGCMIKGEIYYLARRTLFEKPVLKWLLPKVNVISVDRDGQDRAALKIVIRLLEEGHRVLIFPEGTRSPDGSLQSAKPGLGLIAAKTRAPVIPLRIFGSHEALPRGGTGLKFVPIRIHVGKPLVFNEIYKGKEDYQRISDAVMAAIARLGDPSPPIVGGR